MKTNYKKRLYLSPPHMGLQEKENLIEAFDSNWIAPLGPHVDQFEAEFADWIGVKKALALSSGTAALHLALLVAGIKEEDIVFASTFTFAATINPICYIKAKPVFIDSSPETWCLDTNLLEKELFIRNKNGCLPKAIITVDLYGFCPDYTHLQQLCKQYDLLLIEDAAEALGATFKNKKAGTWGDLGVFSFNGNKIITTSGGGMLVSNNPDWINRARYLSAQARMPVSYYQHEDVGYNYRMSNLLAAIGRGQLKVLPERVAARRRIHQLYKEKLAILPGIVIKDEPKENCSNYWLTCILIEPHSLGASPKELQDFLEEKNIEARLLWKPMHLQPVFRDYDRVEGEFSQKLFETGLCLPSGSQMEEEDVDRVVNTIKEFCEGQ